MIGICSSLKRPCFKDKGGKIGGSSLKKPLSEDDGHENTHSSLKTPLFKDECLGELTFKPVEEILDAMNDKEKLLDTLRRMVSETYNSLIEDKGDEGNGISWTATL